MEYFKLYLKAFKKCNDYETAASRKEFNFFVLFYFIFWLVLYIPIIICGSFLSVIGIEIPGYLALSSLIGWAYYLIHFFPFLALIKRRLLSINPFDASKIFGIFLTVEIIRIMICIADNLWVQSLKDTMVKSESILLSNAMVLLLVGFINFAISIALLCFYVYLMTKQGNYENQE